MPTAKAATWFVLVDDPHLQKPRVVKRGLGEIDGRRIVRELNERAEREGRRELYFAEFFETSSVVDVEHSQS